MMLAEVLRCCDDFENLVNSRSFLAGDTFSELVSLRNRFVRGQADSALVLEADRVIKRIERYWLGFSLGVAWKELETLRVEALDSVTMLRIISRRLAPRPPPLRVPAQTALEPAQTAAVAVAA
ncbi:MAG TPA: hypothetical protein VM074_08135 [Solimonas sp.]|nr:hypothetical protein [Solimonas sp.]